MQTISRWPRSATRQPHDLAKGVHGSAGGRELHQSATKPQAPSSQPLDLGSQPFVPAGGSREHMSSEPLVPPLLGMEMQQIKDVPVRLEWFGVPCYFVSATGFRIIKCSTRAWVPGRGPAEALELARRPMVVGPDLGHAEGVFNMGRAGGCRWPWQLFR